MKRYLVILAVAMALGVIGVRLGATLKPPAESVPTQEQRVVRVDLTISPDERITPPLTIVAKDHQVKLRITNRSRRPVMLALMGYQDRLKAAYVLPDSVWQGEFVADRPGEGFAWMLEGAPIGTLHVTGSHLVEGHR